jgi:hypothetical protein
MCGGKPITPGMRVCSACDGDYEDPERTAWSGGEDAASEELSGDQAEQSTARERFPVSEE